MRTCRAIAVGASLAFAAFGCGGSNGGDGDGDGDGDFVPAPPAGCELTDPGAVNYPAGPYGTDVGDTIEDISLEDCDGTIVTLGQVLAQAPVTLLNVGAGWCQPCIDETETIDEEIFGAFCGRGLRVVQIMFQDEQSRAATSLFCKEWRGRYKLNFPVVYDPLFLSNRYFESVQAETPLNFLLDANGEILFKEIGMPGADLPSRIDALLPQ